MAEYMSGMMSKKLRLEAFFMLKKTDLNFGNRYCQM